MRRFLIFAFLSLLLSASTAFASGVLLPSDDADTFDLPNLGLIPRSAKTIKPPTETTDLTPEESAPAILSKKVPCSTCSKKLGLKAPSQKELEAMLNKSNLKKAPTLPITPGGTIAKGKMTLEQSLIARQLAAGKVPQRRKKNPFVEKIEKMKAQWAKKHERDPTFIDEYANISIKGLFATDNTIDVGVLPRYQWGERDVRIIERALGYTAQEIPQYCQLRMDATAETSENKYIFKKIVLAGTKAGVDYAGELTTVKLQPRALCKPPRKALPRNGSIITRSGENYAILLLGRAKCKPTSYNPDSVLVLYGGDGQTSCKFN
ncbi:MAG TPA: hypothetical protein DD400_05475 [Rhodospirillaceae bacterium]|nr:hypothetical protein [Rhodospirillaceae bacterium]